MSNESDNNDRNDNGDGDNYDSYNSNNDNNDDDNDNNCNDSNYINEQCPGLQGFSLIVFFFSGFENYGVINAAIGAGTPSQGYGSYHGMYGSTPPVLYGSGANTPAANTPLSTPGFPTMYEET